mmetsp:Transcript_20537/g.44873  ORF Transcript_20537/g.44873 Transcript_20537/m.44873 type:complete len:218 (-) Transcript_20537:563-1216(-)|eukprot:CAMPEP_0170570846 /NCGR_PEP_ID=MMETSP0224-20130122/1335_1 /TAXON_ID=285029 /ORGANISM="Togula jolla, Strain CCCM 725" /LENGTH=217 /DNA_ID=CAMNT_0010893165 /DNA_START=84 /DNA_END=737 /DNA_ORIENTATION=-
MPHLLGYMETGYFFGKEATKETMAPKTESRPRTVSKSTTARSSSQSPSSITSAPSVQVALTEANRMVNCLCSFTGMPRLDPGARDLVCRAIALLKRELYCTEDVCMILAHALVYTVELERSAPGEVQGPQVGNLIVMLIFIADSYVQDNAVPLRIWHMQLFKKSCSLRTLNLAVVRLLKGRQYLLRVPHSELNAPYLSLIAASCGIPMRRPRETVDI